MHYLRAVLSALTVVGSVRLAPAADIHADVVVRRPGPVVVVAPPPRAPDVIVVRPRACRTEVDRLRVGERHVVRLVTRCG